MKNDDLSTIKYIGKVRKNHLQNSGSPSFFELSEMPVEKLAKIDSIGEHYARLIKEAATAHCASTKMKKPAETGIAKKIKKSKVDQNFRKQLELLKRRLKQTKEKLVSQQLQLFTDTLKSTRS